METRSSDNQWCELTKNFLDIMISQGYQMKGHIFKKDQQPSVLENLLKPFGQKCGQTPMDQQSLIKIEARFGLCSMLQKT